MRLPELPGLGLVLDLLCPPRCVFCGTDVGEDDGPRGPGCGPVSCRACVRGLTEDAARCLLCGEVRAATCGCGGSRRERGWDGIVVLGGYADELRDAVLRAKRAGNEPIAGGLAGLLVRKHEAVLRGWDVDVVVPVPMHWSRRVSRGTSTADELARGVARALGLPSRRLLRRIRATPMQNELPVSDRRRNVIDAFRSRNRVAGRRVLVVDDVTTTGSTLAGCGHALAAAGAAFVGAAVAARADRCGVNDPE